MDIIQLPNGKIKVKRRYLDKNFMAFMPQNIFWMDEDAGGYITISKSSMDKMIQDKAIRDAKDKALSQCVEKNNKGTAYEKSGNISAAIRIYEENISSIHPYPARHAFDRLMIIYRKQKDYTNEIRVIEKAIKVFPSEPKYKERLVKTKLLNMKSLSSKCGK